MFQDFKNNQGFTLIEVVISITLLALMMAYIIDIIDDSIKTKENIIEEDRELMQVEMALARISLDFIQIYSPLYYSAEKNFDPNQDDLQEELIATAKYSPTERFPKISVNSQPIPTIENPNNYTFSFLTQSNRRKIQDSKESNFTWIKYDLISSENQGPENNERTREGGEYELIRYSAPINVYGPDFTWDKINAYPLLKNLKKIQFSFWDPNKRKFVEKVRELSNEKDVLRALKVNLTWISPSGGEMEFERLLRPLWPYFDTKKDEEEKKKLHDIKE
jgi:prepilin-type N-terminal cleavage/methylation domain-containing protein